MYLEYLWNLISKDWRALSKEDAARSPYYGLRGWLLLFYGIAAVGVVTSLIDSMSPPKEALVAAFGDRPNLIRAMLIFSAAAQIPFLVLAPMKHRLMPRFWLAGLWLPVMVYAAAIDMPGRMDAMLLYLAWAVGGPMLMTWYVLHSKRVNVTYLHRVPADSGTAAHSGPASVARTKGNVPKPAFYQRADKASRVFWGLAILFAVAIVIILLKQ